MGMRFMNIALFWLYFICRKGDYYRYLAEFSSGAERKEAADQSLEAYKVLVIMFCLVLLYSCIHVNNIFFFGKWQCRLLLRLRRLDWHQHIQLDLAWH